MMQDFADKTALVTGSNSGTGKAAAQQLAERGAHVILSGRDKARGDAAAAEILLAEVTEVRNVIIIGSGPSGYTAALYAARAELKPLVFEGSVTAGGALMQTTDVENFPGFPDAIMGPELMDSMRKQAERFGAELLADDVIAVDLTADPKVVKTDSETYLAETVIIATGSRYKELRVPGEKELGGHGVSWCATCDGFFFRGHDIAVIGGGDSAMEEAMFLTRFGKSVTVVHRRDTLRASKIMQERAMANPKITFLWDGEVAEVLGPAKVTGLLIRSTKDGTEQVLPVTGVFVAIGHDPRSDLFAGQLATDPDGYLLVDQPSTRTAIDGVFACGDVVDRTYRQAVTAAGTGCAAALDAERWLAGKEH
jgi:thioredoxin reductase (NADPH)